LEGDLLVQPGDINHAVAEWGDNGDRDTGELFSTSGHQGSFGSGGSLDGQKR
jgi:hypothetical protein